MQQQAMTRRESIEFIGWDQPVLTNVVERLLVGYGAAKTWDMRGLMIVLPTSIARRRLNELLALRAQAASKVLYPPRVVTVGELPEHLYVAKLPFAGEMVQNLAWTRALQSLTTPELQKLVPVPPPKQAAAQWLELGKVIARLHRELASERLDFSKVILALGKSHSETPRWKTLVELQKRYLAELNELKLWDIQTARLCALDLGEAATDLHLLVVACVDLNRSQRGFLQAVQSQVRIWIAAPEDRRALFDEFGCLVSENWQSEVLDLPSESLLVGNSPTDQAELTCACLAELGSEVHVRQVTLGVPDSSLLAELKHHLELSGLKGRFGPGSPLVLSEPMVLLRHIARFLEDRSYTAFASLIRHPAVEHLLRDSKLDLPPDWLAKVDKYYQGVLPKTVGRFINKSADGAREFEVVSNAILRWLHRLSVRPQPISAWVQPLLTILAAAYDRLNSEGDDPQSDPLYVAATQTCAAILSLRDIPDALEPKMTISELIDWLVRNVSDKLVPEPHDEHALEMLGWLELMLDDAPHLIIAGIHDGVVPESLSGDPFLPNQLRRNLGMMDNARRFARDMYAMRVIRHTREQLRIVVGKTDASGDPLVPSRLLMACELSELPARVLHLVQEENTDVLPAVERRWKPRAGGSQLIVPRPAVVDPPRHITVTAFRDFLKCPYRFYLRHVLKLREEADADAELDAPKFGVLIHDTLEMLGKSPVGKSTDPEEVRQFLVEQLHVTAERMFGLEPPAAVLIQIEQAELRLEAFAPQQAARAAEGWEIRHVECGVGYEDEVLIGREQELTLIGRIDRIDYHPASGRWAIWDYKTSDSAKAPVNVHWTKDHGWRDLQLPMYLPVAEKLGVTGTPSLGYIALPKQAADAGFFVADFSAAQLREAAAVADEVASKVAACEFWPDELTEVQFDDFGRICQTQVQHVVADPPSRHPQRYLEQQVERVPAEIVETSQALLKSELAGVTKAVFKPELIRASAGTGKTYQLTNRLLRIVLSGQEVDGILATTFTRKAAGEIIHRLLQRLATACVNATASEELQQALPEIDASQAACLAALRRVTASIHRLRISTLDSFFAQVARTFSFEMGLPPGWTPMEPTAEPQVQMQAVAEMLDRHDRKTLVNLVRMLAKGESGRRVADEILQTVRSGYEAYRGTTRELWDQLPLPAAPSEAALESALLTLEQTRLGNKRVDPQLEKLHLAASMGNWEAVMIHGIYKNLAQGHYWGAELPGDLVIALEALAERAVAELLPIRRSQTLASFDVIHSFDAEYTALIRRQRALAFADVTYYLSKWMTGPANGARQSGNTQARSQAAEQLEFRLDCGVQHLLLDEFQDTSPDQWRILRPLAEPLGGGPRSDQSFFCVGDTKQAIYGWRGGVAEIFDSVRRSVSGLEETSMQLSYRSSPVVMEAVNDVFQNLSRHTNLADCDQVAAEWSRAFPEHRSAREELNGYVLLQNGPKIDRGTPLEEAKRRFLEFTALQIADLTRQSTASVGVLFRTNADVARMIGLLRDAGVSASQDGGNPLTDSAAVQLMLSLIHLADHPGDGVCAFHVGTSPLARHLPFSTQRDPQAFSEWFRREVSRRGLSHTLRCVADHLVEHLSWWDQHRLEQLLRSAHAFDSMPGGRLREFEESVERERVALPTESQVKVMTIHKSKGLEFDAVFLPELTAELSSSSSLLVLRGDDPVEPPDGVLRYMNSSLQAMLPTSWQRAFDQHKARGVREALCMLYVAMTRARRALVMTARPTSSPPTQQFGSLLQSTLATKPEAIREPGAVLFESGDAEWWRSMPGLLTTAADDKAPSKATDPETDSSQPLRIQFSSDSQSAPARGLRVPPRRQPLDEPVAISQAFSLSQSLGTIYGTLMHAFLAQIEWLEDYRPDHRTLRREALATLDAELLQHVDIERVIAEFEDLIHLPNVRRVLQRSRYQQPLFGFVPDRVEVERERPISLVEGDQLRQGTIDRMALLFSQDELVAVEIFDYKTDAFDPRLTLLWLDDRLQQHRPQMDTYTHAVSQLFGLPLDRIATYLVMLSSDDLLRVESSEVAAVSMRATPPKPHAGSRANQARGASSPSLASAGEQQPRDL